MNAEMTDVISKTQKVYIIDYNRGTLFNATMYCDRKGWAEEQND